MKLASFDAIVYTLNNAEVRFIVVGGLAVVTHGYGRITRDVDLVIRLEQDSIIRCFQSLARIGYLPRVPITPEQFADPAKRTRWIIEKQMRVLNFFSDLHRETPLDLFITEPFDFEVEYQRALVQESSPGLPVRILRLSTLLQMKRQAGRPQDLADIDELNLLHGERSSYDT